MDVPLSILTPQAPRAGRPSGRPSDAAPSGAGEFARMLTALAPEETVTSDGVVDDPLACGEVPGVAGAEPTEAPGTAALPGSALLRRGMLIAAGRAPEQGTATALASVPDALPEVEAVSAKEEPSVPILPASDDATASSTSLMQWMLQMVPPAPPMRPSEVGRLGGSGRPTGDALTASGRTEVDGKPVETRAKGAVGPLGQQGPQGPADRFSDMVAPEGRVARKPEATVATIPAPVDPVRVWASLPEAGRVASADVLSSGTAQAAAQAAVAAATAAATPTMTLSGSPVVAPAQTWIQTPVTQPGFSDEVVVELVRRVGQAEQGTHEVMLHLNPAEMGPVSVSIELKGATARVEFSASEALTRQHLEAALPGLSEALRQDGLSLQHGAVHEPPPDASSAEAGLSGGSAGSGADPRSRGEPAFDGRAGFGERGPRPSTQTFMGPAQGTAEPLPLAPIGPGPGRIGRLDLFA